LPLILETIKIENAEVFNLSYHQKRFDKTRKELFNTQTSIALSSLIKAPGKGLYRCRILYNDTVISVEYIPYKEKSIQTLKVVSSDLSYPYKYANRDTLNRLLQNNTDTDEIIIEKEGYITDTSIANLAFYDGKQWFTPKKPLLEGTMRAKLLDKEFLQVRSIKSSEISNYKKVALMNAMIGFKIINPIITYSTDKLLQEIT